MEELFGIDLRTLALVRIVAASLVLVDLIWCAKYLIAFYTDKGVLPRAALMEKFWDTWSISLHFMNGRVEIQAMLFVIAGIFALMMLIGYRTRLVTFLSWLFLISLNARNPIITDGGDRLLALLLFWGIFVPWGARYSVDSALNTESRRWLTTLLSVGTVALLLQMPLVYIFTALHKNSPEWRTEFTAVYYVLNCENYATRLGVWVAQWPMPILKIMTALTLLFEIVGPILLFSPFLTRIVRPLTVLAFIVLQICFGLCLDLGLFPWVSSAAILPFIPVWFWEKLSAHVRTPERTRVCIYFDGDCEFCKKTALLLRTFLLLPETLVIAAQASPDIDADMKRHNSWVVVDYEGNRHFKFEALTYLIGLSPLWWLFAPLLRWGPVHSLGTRIYERVAHNRIFWAQFTAPLSYRPIRLKQPLLLSLFCAFFFVYVVVDNFDSINSPLRMPRRLIGVGTMLRISQPWRMFAPPNKSEDWPVIVGKLRNNREVDLFTNGGPVTWQKPDVISASFQNYRWRKYWSNISIEAEAVKDYRLYYARYLCREWNTHHGNDELLKELTIYKLEEAIRLNGSKDIPGKVMLWEHRCFEISEPNKSKSTTDAPPTSNNTPVVP